MDDASLGDPGTDGAYGSERLQLRNNSPAAPTGNGKGSGLLVRLAGGRLRVTRPLRRRHGRMFLGSEHARLHPSGWCFILLSV